jgi:peptidoglycan/LPS O-acetylase OafA/YrhL
MPEPIERDQRYIPGLDGLRAIAVLAVIAYHLGPGWAGGGLLGVGVFFTLSGYLITDLLLAQLAQGRIYLTAFWLARARRLLPALFTMLIAVTAWVTVLGPHQPPEFRSAVGTAIVYVNNWWLVVHDVSYFQAFEAHGPLGHLWSLSVEEHFYIVWPAVLLVALAVIKVHGPRLGLTGALEGRTAARLGGVGLVVLAWLSLGPGITDRPAMFVAGLPLATLAGVGVCAACATTPNAVSRLFEARSLRWLGGVSYGGYLAHYPIYFAFGYELTGMSARQSITVITLSLLAAAAIERFVERPFRSHPTPAPERDWPEPAQLEVASSYAVSTLAEVGVGSGRIGPV